MTSKELQKQGREPYMPPASDCCTRSVQSLFLIHSGATTGERGRGRRAGSSAPPPQCRGHVQNLKTPATHVNFFRSTISSNACASATESSYVPQATQPSVQNASEDDGDPLDCKATGHMQKLMSLQINDDCSNGCRIEGRDNGGTCRELLGNGRVRNLCVQHAASC